MSVCVRSTTARNGRKNPITTSGYGTNTQRNQALNRSRPKPMDIKPIPVPASGSALAWKLDAPYSARHVFIIATLLVVILFTGHRTEMDRMIAMSVQAVGKLLGVVDESQVVHGLSRVA